LVTILVSSCGDKILDWFTQPYREYAEKRTIHFTINGQEYTALMRKLNADSDAKIFHSEQSDSIYMMIYSDACPENADTIRYYQFGIYIRMLKADWEKQSDKALPLQMDPMKKNSYYFGITMKECTKSLWYNCIVEDAELTPGTPCTGPGYQRIILKLRAYCPQNNMHYVVKGEGGFDFVECNGEQIKYGWNY